MNDSTRRKEVVTQSLLVVEPDPDVAAALVDSLEAVCAGVAIAPDASCAIAWADAHGTPDVTVIDLDLPDLAPSTLVAVLRRQAGERLPRFYVSRDPKVRARFGGSPVLNVPFEPSRARAVLSETLIETDVRHLR